MKSLLVFIVVLFIAQNVQACLNAQQTRIFPIGKSPDGLIILETTLNRGNKKDTKDPEMIAAWYGKSYLKIYDNLQNELFSQLISDSMYIVDATYIKDMLPFYKKALAITQQKFHDGFIPAQIQDIQFIDYKTRHKGIELIKDMDSLLVYLKMKRKPQFEIDLLNHPTYGIQQYLDVYVKWKYEFDHEVMEAAITGLRMSSVRTYSIGDETLKIVHLGSGERIEPLIKPKRKDKPEIEVDNQLYNEPILHHGQSFDYIIRN